MKQNTRTLDKYKEVWAGYREEALRRMQEYSPYAVDDELDIKDWYKTPKDDGVKRKPTKKIVRIAPVKAAKRPPKTDTAYEAYIKEQEDEIEYLEKLVSDYTGDMSAQENTINNLDSKLKATEKLATAYQKQRAEDKAKYAKDMKAMLAEQLELKKTIKALETKLAMHTQLPITRHIPKIDTEAL